MKMNLLSKITRVSRALLLATLAILATGAVKAQSGTNFFTNTINGISLNNNLSGAASSPKGGWAIFALSGGVTITDPVSTQLSDPSSYDVYGNVAIAGAGNLSMTSSWIKGHLYVNSNSQTVPPPGGPAPFYLGTKVVDGPYLTNGVAQATAASNAASALANNTGTLTYTGGISGASTSISLTAAASITGLAATTYVMNLTDMILSGSAAVLTLNGTDTTNYVFNVSRFLTLSNQAKIVLGGGGITQANVLYNVKSNAPQYDVNLSGGSELNGIILAKDRTVKLTGGSKVVGEVIAKGVSLSGVSKVINPFASP